MTWALKKSILRWWVKSTSLSRASISAGLVGGVIMLRLGINRALWVFGFIQLITIGGFIWLAAFGHFDQIGAAELWKLGFVIAGEYIGVGLGTKPPLLLLWLAKTESALYSHSVSLYITSLSALPSKGLGMLSGYLVKAVGYYHFFWICLFLAIPGMICLFWVAPWNDKGNEKA